MHARLKVVTVFGTRPEAIKMAPVIHELKRTSGVDCRICVTGQHRAMLDQVLNIFQIKPDEDLNLMAPGQTLASLTANAIRGLDGYFSREKPDVVLVQGDTSSVLAGALAAFYRKIPLAHIEAGLRTGNMSSPWPEEANRVLTSRLAAIHFAPTERNRNNLLGEGISAKSIVVTGNTVVDALFYARDKILSTRNLRSEFSSRRIPEGALIIAVTLHRRENFGSGVENACQAIVELAKERPGVHFVFPMHPNPDAREPVQRMLGDGNGGGTLENIHLIEPLEYLDFVHLMMKSHLILTDSGGVQEEAPSLGVPVLVLRDTTERQEAVEAGTVILIGTQTAAIKNGVNTLLDDPALYGAMRRADNPYGDGRSAKRIVSEVLERYGIPLS